jgi:hypothetical protein
MIVKRYFIHNIETGKIGSQAFCPEEDLALYLDDVIEAAIETTADEIEMLTHYAVNGSHSPRPIMPCTLDKDTILANGIDAAILSNLPNPSIVTVGSQVVEVTDGTLTITVNYAKDYPIKVEAFPHLDWQGMIHGT